MGGTIWSVIGYQHDEADPSSLSQNVVFSIHEDRAGVLWVGTLGGISLWDPVNNRFTHYAHDPDDPQSLSHNWVIAIYEDPAGASPEPAEGASPELVEGVVWIGTWGGGLNRFDRATGTFTHYTELDGLAGDAVSCILADADGFLWLGTNKGLSRFDPHTETFRNYDAGDGLQSGEFWSCFQSERGEMLFGGSHGLNSFYPKQVNRHIPPIVITAFDKFNQTERTDLAANEHIQLSYQDNFISFEFAALDFAAPERNQYTYMMEGLDKDWVYAGTRRYAEYPNLRPGDYVFRVRGSNNDGVWNEEGTAVRITVTPPVWATWWFRGIAGLILVAGVFVGYRLRVRRIQARSRELERQVEERTREIEQRREVAEGLRDILAVLNSNRPLDEILAYTVTQAGRLLGSGASVLHHIEQDREFVAIEASHGLPAELTTIEGFPLHASRADAAILNRRAYIVRDLHAMEPAAVDDVEGDAEARRWLAVTRQHYRSLLAVPLIVEGEVYGCIAFYYVEPQPFPDEEIGLAVAFADQAALAIENAGLRAQAEEAAVTAERNRLARDMHDSVTQSLYSLTLLAEAGQRMIKARDLGQVEGNQARLSEIAQQALQEMRLMVYELRPSALESEGLVGALEHRLEAVERRAGVDARLVVEGACDLPPRVEEELYHITQEALNNALKHAQASAVKVTLRAEDGYVLLEVTDNGSGFDPATVRGMGGLGLVTMQERAEKISGTLTVDSSPNEGTKVRVVVG
jgi:signal transduction histidine kinase